MKISNIKTWVVDCYRTNWLFIKIETDEGLEGIGEATLEYKENAIQGAVKDLTDYLIGKNPMEIEKHIYMIYRDSYWKAGPVLMSAISGIEIAMWDIKGKYYNAPIYELLGGKFRDDIKFYANGWFNCSKTSAEFAMAAKSTVKKGIMSLKWDPFGSEYLTISNKELDKALECIGAVREAVGSDVDLLIEGHGRFNATTAIKISKAIEEFNPMLFEEPVPPDNLDVLGWVHSNSPVPIAAGERMYGKHSFLNMISRHLVDYIQPDVSHAGGILELKKIAAIAEAMHIGFVPHNPSGPIANAATLQLAACIPNFEILETMITDVEWRNMITTENLSCYDGKVIIQEGNGLGIDLIEEALDDYPYHPKKLRHYNGELTNIRPKKAKDIYKYI